MTVPLDFSVLASPRVSASVHQSSLVSFHTEVGRLTLLPIRRSSVVMAKDVTPVGSLEELPMVLTVAEAARALRISHTTAYELAHRWMATGGAEGLPVVQLGRVLRVPRAAVGRLLAVGIESAGASPSDGRHGAT
jgi:excisionase family DNA binding protein